MSGVDIIDTGYFCCILVLLLYFLCNVGHVSILDVHVHIHVYERVHVHDHAYAYQYNLSGLVVDT